MPDVRHMLTIPGWQPTRLNDLLGVHWALANRRKRGDRELVVFYARQAGIPSAVGKRRVSLTIILAPRQRAADPDAYWKSTLDALVHAGVLLDDNRQGVQLGDVAFVRGPERATTIWLDDLPDLKNR